jgi:hypothetical protein
MDAATSAASWGASSKGGGSAPTLQQHVRKLVLHVVGKGRYRRNGLFK